MTKTTSLTASMTLQPRPSLLAHIAAKKARQAQNLTASAPPRVSLVSHAQARRARRC